MLNKLERFLREREMVSPGDTVVAAVSGGADSVALLFALYLLKDKLEINLEAAHFNHNLRGEESDRDEAFVRQLCDRYDVPLHVGSGVVTAGERAWKRRPGMPGMPSFGTFPERSPPPIRRTTMPRRC